MLNYLNLAARSGILVKNAHALEQLSAIDTIVFDKTGTLTLEQPHIAQVHTLSFRPLTRIHLLLTAKRTTLGKMRNFDQFWTNLGFFFVPHRRSHLKKRTTSAILTEAARKGSFLV